MDVGEHEESAVEEGDVGKEDPENAEQSPNNRREAEMVGGEHSNYENGGDGGGGHGEGGGAVFLVHCGGGLVLDG